MRRIIRSDIGKFNKNKKGIWEESIKVSKKLNEQLADEVAKAIKDGTL